MIRVDLRDADAVLDAANDLDRAGHAGDAADLLTRALTVAQANAALAFRLGVLRAGLGQRAAAKVAYRRALAADPTHFGALNNLAAAHLDDDEAGDAIALFERAWSLRPDEPQLIVNLGNAHYAAGDMDRAESLHRRALDLRPDFAPAESGLGTSLIALGRTVEAVAAFRRAVSLDAANADDHSRLGMALLSLGEVAEGGAEYEWRWRASRFTTPPRDFPFRRWRGEALDGKTILVWGEQGVGDEVLMLGQIARLIPRAKRVLIECDPRLVPLVERSWPAIAAHGRPGHGKPPAKSLLAEKIDYQIPAFSLFPLLAPTPDDLAPAKPALDADPDRRDACRQRYDALGPGLKIGIAWHSANRRRAGDSAPLAAWGPILRQPGVQFVDLQYGDREDERRAAEEAFGIAIHRDETIDPLMNLEDFAAQLAALDLVVSTANTTVDMAGALGVETWTLLPPAPDWRWFLSGDRVFWYPSLRLFRWRTGEPDSAVVDRVAAALREKLAG